MSDSSQTYGPISITEHYLDPTKWITKPPLKSTITVSSTGLVWNNNQIPLITHFTQIQKIVITKAAKGKKLKLKLCIQNNKPKTPGIMFIFEDENERKNCNDQLKILRDEAIRKENQTKNNSVASAGGISSGFTRVSSTTDIDTPSVIRLDLDSEESISNKTKRKKKVTQQEIEARKKTLERHPELHQEYQDLVIGERAIITTEEFWHSRRNLVHMKGAERAAEGVDRIMFDGEGSSGSRSTSPMSFSSASSSDSMSSTLIDTYIPRLTEEHVMDLTFSLRDWEKDKDGNYLINSRMISKACGLYPWLLKAFRDQVPSQKNAKEFWKEFLSYIQTHDGVVELKGLEGSTYASYHTNWETKRDTRKRSRNNANVQSLSYEVGETAAHHAEILQLDQRKMNDGYGMVGLQTGFQQISSSNKNAFKHRSKKNNSNNNQLSKHSAMDVETRNQRSSQALRIMLHSKRDRTLKIYWEENNHTGCWSYKQYVTNNNGEEILNIFEIAEKVHFFTNQDDENSINSIPTSINGLGLSGPPKEILIWTRSLFNHIQGNKKYVSNVEFNSFRRTFVSIFGRYLMNGSSNNAIGESVISTSGDGGGSGSSERNGGGASGGANGGRSGTSGNGSVSYTSMDGSHSRKIVLTKDGDERHPDLYLSQEWESDPNRYHPMKEIGDKILSGKRKRPEIKSNSSKSNSSSSSSSNNSNSNSNSQGTSLSTEKDTVPYTALVSSTASRYKEPTAMIAMDVFTCTMKNIEGHVDTSITQINHSTRAKDDTNNDSNDSNNSNNNKRQKRGTTKFEQLNRKVQKRMVRHKQELTELLRYFWGAVQGKDFVRCQDLYERIEKYGEELRTWKNSLEYSVKHVVEPFVLVMTTQVAKVKEKMVQIMKNQQKKKKKKR